MTQSELTEYESDDEYDGYADPARFEDVDRPWRDVEIVHRLYWHEELNQGEIADVLNCGKTTVGNGMRDNDIPRRTHREAMLLNGNPYEVSLATRFKGHVEWAPPSATSIGVHRLLAVHMFGFDAVCGMNVHHKNDIPWDNRPENLELMTRAEHSAHHQRKVHGIDRLAIAEMYEHGEITSRDLADQYDVSQPTVTFIHEEYYGGNPHPD